MCFSVHCCKTLKPFSPDLNNTLKSTNLDDWGISLSRWCWGQVCFLCAAIFGATTTDLIGTLARNQDTQALSLRLGIWITPFFLGLQLPPTSRLSFPVNSSGTVIYTTGSQSVVWSLRVHEANNTRTLFTFFTFILSVQWSFPGVPWHQVIMQKQIWESGWLLRQILKRFAKIQNSVILLTK